MKGNFPFGRRLPVRWGANSWRPRIIARASLVRLWTAEGWQHQVCIFRQSSESVSERTARPARSLKQFPTLPPSRANNTSRTDL
ncbi:MAG: hypothetical protein E6L09_15770 [Verrucomicrobia bacterium]|nr:MAG: hypothetical protein E6L09_15770 [Verrucomicrobiota bacterium]